MEKKQFTAFKRDLERAKNQLIERARKSGIYENFGVDEIHKINDKYSCHAFNVYKDFEERAAFLFRLFIDWCAWYDGKSENN